MTYRYTPLIVVFAKVEDTVHIDSLSLLELSIVFLLENRSKPKTDFDFFQDTVVLRSKNISPTAIIFLSVIIFLRELVNATVRF